MFSFNPATLIPSLQKANAVRFDPDAHHTIAVLQIMQDNGFQIRGDGDDYLLKLQEGGPAALKELTFSHTNFKGAWFIWDIESGVVEITEGAHPEVADELVDIDINDFLGAGVDDELLVFISEILGETEMKESLSWAECVDKLQEFEICSDEEDLEMMQAFVHAMECKILNRG